MLFRPLVYIQVSSGQWAAQVVGTTARATVPAAALAHPRTMMGASSAVEAAMKQVLSKLGLRGWFKRAPVVLTHLLPQDGIGYTEDERRAFHEAALAAGAARAFLLTDRPALDAREIESLGKHFGKAVL